MTALPSDSLPEPDFRALFESAPGSYLVLLPDPAFTIVAVSDAYLSATMTKREDILGRGLFDVFPDNPSDPVADGVGNLRASLGRVSEHGAPDTMAIQKYDIRRPESEGGGFEERYWSPVNSPVLDEDKKCVYIIHRVDDATEFVRLKGLERYHLLFERNPQPMWVYDVDTLMFVAVNEAAVRHYGYSREEFMAMTIKDIRPTENVTDLLDPVSKPTEEFGKAGVWKHRKKDGTIIEAEISAQTLNFAGRSARLVLANDITERKRAEQTLRETEEQLRQSQKLESVGQLAGGIAHDFNNLLTVIGGYTDLLLMADKLDDPTREKMEEVKKASERAASLTRQLLAFSRKQVLKPEVLDLNLLIEGTGKILRRLIGEDIEVTTKLRSDVGKIMADPGQIEQVVINLVLNARDAMPSGGKIMLATAQVELDREYADMRIAVKPGHYVMLAVSDTGTGMPTEVQKHIFEPFFTTKEVGKGTGLGLSMIYGIVKQSGGNIWVYSEVGKGTTFKVYLPLTVGEEAEKSLTADTPQAAAVKATETILLVEDEEMVRKLAADILRAKGYQVLVAKNGDEATEICKTHSHPIHLLLTDVIMPGMNGKEVAEMVRSFQPEIEVLYMSGYTDDIIVHHGVLETGTSFIEKPFTAGALTRKVHEVLNRAAPTNLVSPDAESIRQEAV
jgi:two-component system, cell cycle sensor histidine kinase and response regulator CckA